MKNKVLVWMGILLVSGSLMAGCGSQTLEPSDKELGAETIVETQATEEKTVDKQEENIEQESKTPAKQYETTENLHIVQLNGDTATLDGTELEEFDYTWHIDPSHEEEWYEGTEPSTDAAAYIARDIIYYPLLNEDGFTLQNYDGEREWVYHYTAEGLEDYIFSTLPSLGTELPVEMMHSAEEAYANPVLHITKPGTYVLQGEWHGQIYVDLGEEDDTFKNPEAKVQVILNNVDVTCDVAPAIVFDDLYECDNEWEDREEPTNIVDTTDAGVVVTIASGSENNFTGANVYRLLRAKYKKDSTSVQKKAHKLDGAFYSFVSMNIEGDDAGLGVLNIRSTTFEGLDDELHLTINGGNINIYSQDDAINVNEDNVSVFTMNGGTLHIFSGLGAEGDGVDSNGYIVVNGGIIAGGTPSGSDSLLDSDRGNTINGGEVIVIGSGRGAGGMGPMRGEGVEGERPFGDRGDWMNKGERPDWPDGERPDWNDEGRFQDGFGGPDGEPAPREMDPNNA